MLLCDLPSIGFFSVSSADTNEVMAATAKEIENFDMFDIYNRNKTRILERCFCFLTW
jgi:hypothetical protein